MTNPSLIDALAAEAATLETLRAGGMSCLQRDAGPCTQCATVGLLYPLEPTEPTSPLVCAPCARVYGHRTKRGTPCDNDPDHGFGWRNPRTGRNEYLCGRCHVESGDGVLLNRWAPRVEAAEQARVPALVCEAAGVVGTRDCSGEVRQRSGGHMLCVAHQGGRRS